MPVHRLDTRWVNICLIRQALDTYTRRLMSAYDPFASYAISNGVVSIGFEQAPVGLRIYMRSIRRRHNKERVCRSTFNRPRRKDFDNDIEQQTRRQVSASRN